MVTYIYFVKCPGCEDEHFDFFDKAKDFALGCLSQKPIITQTEVCRNDFGECTDSADLGTVWSWEDMMKETDTEPAVSVFTKDDLKRIDNHDPEFDAIDNSVDFEPEISEVSSIDEIPDNFRKPIPEGMTIEQLVEEMEENEDTVECAGCEELFPKGDCTFSKEIGWLCPDCVDRVVLCNWCDELFDKSECRYEVDLGWLCSRCEMAIKSRGETLTFREGNYWDFLDEKLDIDIDFSNIIDSSDMEIWGTEPTGENAYKTVLIKRYEDIDYRGDAIQAVHDEMIRLGGLFLFYFDKSGAPALDSWNPKLLRNLGKCDIYFDDARYEQAVEKVFNRVGLTEDTTELHDLGNTYDGGYPEDSKLAELEEAADYRKRLDLCPECGAEQAFDHETGFCLECGFNI